MKNHQTGKRTGVLFVGLLGATASTTVAGASAMKVGVVSEQFSATNLPPFENMMLISCNDMVFGGWDYIGKNLEEAIIEHGIIPDRFLSSSDLSQILRSIKPAIGIKTPLDIPIEKHHNNIDEVESISVAIEQIQNYIENFKVKNKLDCVITIYVGSPPKTGDIKLKTLTYEKFQKAIKENRIDIIPSNLIYAVASLNAGSNFVDFTPSETLEAAFLDELAIERGVQLAGRDGSTGQTMLKTVIGQMLKIRNLHIDSWFSTNILGNHDGYVLQLPGHDEVKIRDKTDALQNILGYDDFEHLVKINYFKSRGDRKESWDVVDFSGWLGVKMSLRLNWYGADSILAAPIILDIVRLIEYGSHYNLSGIQPQLGLYFKRPLQRENIGFVDRFNEIINFYSRLS